MIDIQLPKESESQEIGHYAVTAFNALSPLSWRATPTDGDSDAGLDMQVQVVDRNRYQFIFNAQIKGCRQKNGKGKNKRLNADETYFSQEISIPTLNYYLRVANPVMLVFVDLCAHPNPRKCSAYYLWINEELDKLREDNGSLEHLDTDSHTFRIPVTNIFNVSTDVLPYLMKQHDKRHALASLYSSIKGGNKDPIETVTKLRTKFSSSSVVIDSLLADTDSPWLEAPPDSFASKLKNVSQDLSFNNADLANPKLDEVKNMLGSATAHEQSEYYFLRARLLSLIGKHEDALQLYQRAHHKSPHINKYHLGFLEEQLFTKHGDNHFARSIISQLADKKSLEYVRLRAKLLALVGNFNQAFEIIGDQDEKDVFTVRVLIYLIKKDYKKCVEVGGESLLRKGLTKRQQLSLLAFRARAGLNMGMKHPLDEDPEKIIPFSGPPEIDTEIFKDAWSDVKQVWVIASQLGYPADIEYMLDVSCILGAYFEDIDSFYGHLKHLAQIRPHSKYVQETLLKLAANLGDFKTVLDQLPKFPDEPSSIVFKVLSFYQESKKKLVIETTLEQKTRLLDTKPDNLDKVLAAAAECADDLLLTDERNELLALLDQLENGKAMSAVYEFITEIRKNPLNKDKAVEKLWNVYENGERDIQVLVQLFRNLDLNRKEQAKKITQVAKEIRNQRQLTELETLNLCRAWSIIEGWDEIISIASEALGRFEDSTRLIAMKALALDELGNTPASLDLLDQAVKSGAYDPYAFELYGYIAARCGLTGKARNLFERLFEQAHDNKEKAKILRIIFMLEMSLNPHSDQLIEICTRYGGVNDKNDEIEEGIYFQLFYGATNNEQSKVSETHVKELRRRLQVFKEKYPASNIFRVVEFDKDAPGDLIKRFEEVTGMTVEKKRWYQQKENQLRSGQLPMPFCLKPRVLLNVPNLLYLWEVSKRARKDQPEYHLILSSGSYQLRSPSKYLEKPVLLDDISILILFDLDLLSKCLSCLPWIAIPKSIISQFQLWSQNIFVSPFGDKARRILTILSNHINKIEQPSSIHSDKSEDDEFSLDEYTRLFKMKPYIYYSDDAFARFYVCGENNQERSITTIDIIKLLLEKDFLDSTEAARKYAALCRWNVVGLPVHYIDILRVLKPCMEQGLSIQEAVERLEKNDDFISFIDAIWDIKQDYKQVLKEIGNLISFILLGKEGVHAEDSIIVALWYWWYRKVQFMEKGESSKIDFLARACWVVALNIVSELGSNSKDTRRCISQKLWSIYRDTVQYVYGNQMDEKIEKKMYHRLAKFTAADDQEVSNNVYGFLMGGLQLGTSDSDTFSGFYSKAVIERRKKKI